MLVMFEYFRIICTLCQLAKDLNGYACDRHDRELAYNYEITVKMLS